MVPWQRQESTIFISSRNFAHQKNVIATFRPHTFNEQEMIDIKVESIAFR